jgi:hypothetical protein
MCPVQLSVDVEATLKFALENLSLDATTMAEYEKENGIATKCGLNMLYHVFKVSQLPVFRDSLDMKKTCSVAADGTSSNTGCRRGFFQTPSTMGDEVEVGRAAHPAEQLSKLVTRWRWCCHPPQNPSISFTRSSNLFSKSCSVHQEMQFGRAAQVYASICRAWSG